MFLFAYICKWLILNRNLRKRIAGVAQSVEQLICNQQVAGSSPIASSSYDIKVYDGGVPERPKGADCKSAGGAYGGSNPPPSTIIFEVKISGSSSVARASAFQAEGRGFESRFPLQVTFGEIEDEILSNLRPCSSVGRAHPW